MQGGGSGLGLGVLPGGGGASALPAPGGSSEQGGASCDSNACSFAHPPVSCLQGLTWTIVSSHSKGQQLYSRSAHLLLCPEEPPTPRRTPPPPRSA